MQKQDLICIIITSKEQRIRNALFAVIATDIVDIVTKLFGMSPDMHSGSNIQPMLTHILMKKIN